MIDIKNSVYMYFMIYNRPYEMHMWLIIENITRTWDLILGKLANRPLDGAR